MENKAQFTFTFMISAVNSRHILKISTEPFVLEVAPGGGWLVGDRNTASLVSTQCCTVFYGDHVINLRYGSGREDYSIFSIFFENFGWCKSVTAYFIFTHAVICLNLKIKTFSQ